MSTLLDYAWVNDETLAANLAESSQKWLALYNEWRVACAGGHIPPDGMYVRLVAADEHALAFRILTELRSLRKDWFHAEAYRLAVALFEMALVDWHDDGCAAYAWELAEQMTRIMAKMPIGLKPLDIR